MHQQGASRDEVESTAAPTLGGAEPFFAVLRAVRAFAVSV
jgi:hypothetical protein